MHEINSKWVSVPSKKYLKDLFLCRTRFEYLTWTNLSWCFQFSKGPCGDIDWIFLRCPLWVQFNSTPMKSPSGPSESVFLWSGTGESCSIWRLKEQPKHCISCTAIVSAFPHSSRHWALASHILHYNTDKADWEIQKKYPLKRNGNAEGRNVFFFSCNVSCHWYSAGWCAQINTIELRVPNKLSCCLNRSLFSVSERI